MNLTHNRMALAMLGIIVIALGVIFGGGYIGIRGEAAAPAAPAISTEPIAKPKPGSIKPEDGWLKLRDANEAFRQQLLETEKNNAEVRAHIEQQNATLRKYRDNVNKLRQTEAELDKAMPPNTEFNTASRYFDCKTGFVPPADPTKTYGCVADGSPLAAPPAAAGKAPGKQ